MPLKKQVLSGVFWTFSQQFGVQGISFLVSIILARLLQPEEFGLVAMIGIFMGIGAVLMDGGLGQSLIRTKNPDQEDFSTVFFFNLAGSIIMYGLVYLAAPLIADFFEREILINITRLYCLIFVFNAFSAVQVTRLTKKMDFKTQMFIKIPSLIISSAVGIFMAYSGFGVWSLVWMALIQAFLQSVQYWLWSQWRPSLVFSKKKFRNHFKFGLNLTMSGLLDVLFTNAYTIMIGKFFTATQLGYYNRADSLKQFPVKNIGVVLGKVTYPLFASIQEDTVRLKRVYAKIMKMVIYLVAPTLIFMAVLAEPLFRFLLTDKWLPAVPYFQILCVNGILYPINGYNLNILNVLGRSDLFLRLEIIKKALIVVVLAVSVNFGIFALLYGSVFTSIMAFFINTRYSGKFINYSAWEQTKDLAPYIGLALICGAILFMFDLLIPTAKNYDLVRLLLGSLVGCICYFGSSFLLKMSATSELILLIKRK
ncbi:lipopolysaccharide biosynthesis protein [Salegentibacter sp. BDJ18]|uniref:lipopolysaccharide biosynthesis protein n=1 Tax=Salegentibacter sp. BDJ18 TaxID=2816376 RepID=UPI001AAE6C55|nr:lipopolysaccharide biosynthesis protein [Salegentibacter sp. BDJ18]MBO2544794.1 lipopolysaccharide biosynthesis protein [Salegentibacter sp. BDJ18]